MTIKFRLEQLREKLDEYNVDCFLVPSNDEFHSDYTSEALSRLKYISNFSGSNGLAAISKDSALFFTDGRYLLQAKQELGNDFEIHNIADMFKYLPKQRIGYDPNLHTVANIERYKHYELISCNNLIDEIWHDKPQVENSEVFSYPLKYAGETSESKIQKIQNYLLEKKIDALIITDATNICWLLNIRAHDVLYNPILNSYLIFHQDGRLEIFSNALEHLPLKDFFPRLHAIKDKKVQLDSHTASVAIRDVFENYILAEDPCSILKACKNDVEIKSAKEIHIIDGVAVTKLLYWLDKNYRGESELSVAAKLLELRKLNKRFIYPSFRTIAAFAENGAIIHYSPKESTNKFLAENDLFLLDSGGQYWGGTTDITRVVPIGKASYQQKYDFTLVLKGYIALARGVFPEGITGAEIDMIPRYFLWQKGKDYAHATGHGVGNALCVHELPRIGKHSKAALKPGMIISNEPGFYKNGEYGIRIENLMLVKRLGNGYLALEDLTLAPIDKRLILPKLLSEDEKKWLNSYHIKVYKKLSPFLNGDERLWLKLKTKYIN